VSDPAPQPQGPQRPTVPTFEVELGTHSASNFYKGLSGSDVIEHGGIFVATYRLPKLGSTVRLRVHLPGNYEFHASATVQWTRETGASSDSAEPGFGARITQISQEARQLVYRFTRNREPLFYDDL
jgi:Tfp pilus assembly protein PilZ